MNRALRLSAALLPASIFALATTASAQTVYVDANLTTGAGDGTSWGDAYQGPDGLQAALAASAPGNEIYVADGLYRTAPTTGTRAVSFRLRNDVAIYGGFSGGESNPDERPPFGTAVSTLTADVAGDDPGGSLLDNSYHVVRTNSTNASAILDGFTITGGNANTNGNNNDRGGGILCLSGVTPTIRNCDFVNNRCTFGGGAGYVNGAPTFTNCSFIDNNGGAFGGAFDIAGAGPITFDRCFFSGNVGSRAGALEIFSTNNAFIYNSVFVNNIATGGSGGGAFWVGSGGTTRIFGCTIVGNRANNQAQGGVRAQGATVQLRSSILWNNEGPGGAMNANNQVGGTNNVSYCLVQGGFTGGTGNIATAPSFVDQANGDFTLAAGSPAIDAGDSTALPATVIADREGRRRYFDDPSTADTGNGSAPIVDMGAFEFSTNVGTVFCSDTQPNSTGVPGRIDAAGSASISVNDLTLVASSLPQNSAGFFVTSRQVGFTPNPGGSSGNLCLAGAIGRFVGPGQVQNSGSGGEFELLLDLNQLPTPTVILPGVAGQTWSFQAWHRDAVLGIPTSNFTDVVRVELEL